MLHDILGHDHIQWHSPLIRHFTKSWPCYRTIPYYRLLRHYLIPGCFHRAFATRAASPQRTFTPLDTWSSPFGTCIRSNVETILSELVMSTDLLSFEHPSVLLFCFLKWPECRDPRKWNLARDKFSKSGRSRDLKQWGDKSLDLSAFPMKNPIFQQSIVNISGSLKFKFVRF